MITIERFSLTTLLVSCGLVLGGCASPVDEDAEAASGEASSAIEARAPEQDEMMPAEEQRAEGEETDATTAALGGETTLGDETTGDADPEADVGSTSDPIVVGPGGYYGRRPGWGHRHPGWGHRHPGWGHRHPGWGHRHPGWGHRHPGWGHRHPGWGHRHPGWGGHW